MRVRKIDPYLEARNYAFLLLKFRLRSEKEIAGRLKRKKFPDNVIKETIDFLKAHSFLDDSAFTDAWIDSRLRKKYGPLRLRRELRQKGISDELIKEQLDKFKENYNEEEVIASLAKKRMQKLKGLDRAKAKRRLYAYLAGRGFASGKISQIIAKI